MRFAVLTALVLSGVIAAACGEINASDITTNQNEGNEVTDMDTDTTTTAMVEPTATQQTIDEVWLDEPFTSAMVGGVMKPADDAFRLSVLASDGEIAQLAVLHPTDPSLERAVDVQLRSVFDVGDYQVMIGSVSETSVVASWRSIAGDDGEATGS